MILQNNRFFSTVRVCFDLLRTKFAFPVRIVSLVLAISAPLAGAVFAGSDQATRQAGQTFRDCSDCPEMVVIPPGSFLMGSSAAEIARDVAATLPRYQALYAQKRMASEQPQHSIEIRRSFALSKYPLTRSEFEAFVRATGYTPVGGCMIVVDHIYRMHPEAGWQNPGFSQTDHDPVVCVNWQDAKAYIAWLNEKLHGHSSANDEGPYQLPSEADWEYAARAGTTTSRWWGDAIGSGNAVCDGCGSQWDGKQTAPVGNFPSNAFGVSDVLGGAWEWTEDCWNETYAGAPADGSAWLSGDCKLRVIRGGNWFNRSWLLRSASRSADDASRRINAIGFRVAKAIP